MTLRSFDRVADLYDRTRGYPPAVAGRIADGIVQALSDHTALDGRLLDVGAGTGRHGLGLAQRGVRYVGVDIARGMLERFRARDRAAAARLLLAEASRLPFRDASFAAALTVHVLHVVPDAERMVAEMRRVVRPGGVLLLGMDRWTQRLRDELYRRLQETFAEGERPPPPRTDAMVTQQMADRLEERGWYLEYRVLATIGRRTSAAEVLGSIERRTWSWTWQVREEPLRRALQQLRQDLLAEGGDLDRAVDDRGEFVLHVARPAG